MLAPELLAAARGRGAPGRRPRRDLHLGEHLRSEGDHPRPRHRAARTRGSSPPATSGLRDDRVYVPMAFFWVGGLVFGVLGPMQIGVTILTEHRFDAGEVLQLLATEHATYAMGFPHVGPAIAAHPDFAVDRPVEPARRLPADPPAARAPRLRPLVARRAARHDGDVQLPHVVAPGRAAPGGEARLARCHRARLRAQGRRRARCGRRSRRARRDLRARLADDAGHGRAHVVGGLRRRRLVPHRRLRVLRRRRPPLLLGPYRRHDQDVGCERRARSRSRRCSSRCPRCARRTSSACPTSSAVRSSSASSCCGRGRSLSPEELVPRAAPQLAAYKVPKKWVILPIDRRAPVHDHEQDRQATARRPARGREAPPELSPPGVA